MTQIGTFPFGQPVRVVVQEDRTPKHVFVLGVYASAVHARWVRPGGNEAIKALAVASEPYIFWRGDNAAAIIRQIAIPRELGELVAAGQQFNGPSGKALDEFFLRPLGLARADAWLCDLIPHSCVNPSQHKAIAREYLPVTQRYRLPAPTVPTVPKKLADEARRDAILGEIRESGANVLVLLGDRPIKWFLSHFDSRWRQLSDFGCDVESYGRLHTVRISGKDMEVLPLTHPRQVAKLGQSSASWYRLHQFWTSACAHRLLK